MQKHIHHHINQHHAKNYSIQMLKDRAQAILRDVVRPTLGLLQLNDPLVEKLIMGTGAIESNFVMVTQSPLGPGRGLWQMELKTHNWLRDDVLERPKYHKLKAQIQSLLRNGELPTNDTCVENHKYAVAMARLRYMMIPAAIPGTLHQQGQYWKDHYNVSAHGRTVADYVARWNLLCKPIYPHFA